MAASTGDIVSRVYGGFCGVDFRGEEVNLARSPDSLNVWKDYKETDSIRTRPGMALHKTYNDTIYGIYFYNGEMLVHSGNTLYSEKNGVTGTIYTGLAENKSQGFVYKDVFYIIDGAHYLKYDGTTASDVVGYVPTTSIGRKASGPDKPVGGTLLDDVNILSPYRINTFVAGGGKFFYLDVEEIDSDFVPVVEYKKATLLPSQYDVYYDKGYIFTHPNLGVGEDEGAEVKITYKKAIAEYTDIIQKCTQLQVFDNRVFFSGNPDFPNGLWHCSLNDPTYVSDNDYYQEGIDKSAIKGMVAGNNALWVFREPSDANTTIFYHTPVIDDEYGKVYPSSHSSITIGCVGKAINFNDDIVFFSERGMEGISGDITTEQVAAHRSSLIDRKLISEANYKKMILEEWEGYLLVFIDNKVYLADSRAVFANENHAEYEWFYWELEKNITATKVKDGVLYLGTSDGIYTMTVTTAEDGMYPSTAEVFESYWATPKDKLGVPHKLKTTNKRGCVVEATGDITVYAKVEDSEFEYIGTYQDITDYFVCRIKRKKFKDIQLKFASDTRFSLETATLESFVGGYIKR